LQASIILKEIIETKRNAKECQIIGQVRAFKKIF